MSSGARSCGFRVADRAPVEYVGGLFCFYQHQNNISPATPTTARTRAKKKFTGRPAFNNGTTTTSQWLGTNSIAAFAQATWNATSASASPAARAKPTKTRARDSIAMTRWGKLASRRRSRCTSREARAARREHVGPREQQLQVHRRCSSAMRRWRAARGGRYQSAGADGRVDPPSRFT